MTGTQYNIPDRLMKDIRRFAIQHGVEEILLFGSRARGSNRERSDIDLAVRGGDFPHFYDDVMENAHSLLMFDIIDLNGHLSEELKNEIRRDGVKIYEKVG